MRRKEAGQGLVFLQSNWFALSCMKTYAFYLLVCRCTYSCLGLLPHASRFFTDRIIVTISIHLASQENYFPQFRILVFRAHICLLASCQARVLYSDDFMYRVLFKALKRQNRKVNVCRYSIIQATQVYKVTHGVYFCCQINS